MCLLAVSLSRALDKEKTALVAERDRRNQTLHTLKNDLHRMELERKELDMKMQEKGSLEERVSHWKQDITSMTARLKVRVTVGYLTHF